MGYRVVLPTGRAPGAKHSGARAPGPRQRGVVLFVSVLFLFLLTLLGITSMNDSLLQERMTSNYRDRSMAFQAGETGLQVAQTWIASHDQPPDSSILPSDLSYSDSTFDDETVSNALPAKLAQTPEITIEELNEVDGTESKTTGTGPPTKGRQYYRVIVEAWGGTDDSRVVLKTTYARR